MAGKVFYLDAVFNKDLPTAAETIESIFIEGYANTTSVDRSGDVITAEAWKTGMQNYLKNPIILSQHDYDEPIGEMVDYTIDSKGLWVKARISAAAEDTFNLIKDGVLKTFSVGFLIKDATYDAVTDLFIIKQVELLEISVVSVPCNQDSIFSLSKDFVSSDEYKDFKKTFAATPEALPNEEVIPPAAQTQNKELNMDPKELELLLKKAAEDAATTVIKAQEEAKAKAEAEAKAKAEEEARIKSVVIEVGTTGAERLLADVESRLKANEAHMEEHKNVLTGLEASIKEKSEELRRLQESKMTFGDHKADADGVTMEEKELAVMLGKFTRKGIAGTKYGSALIQKVGPHVAGATWETEVSLNMEADIRRKLVLAPIFRNINMATNVMKLPMNPDAGLGTWIANTEFGTTASPGAAQTHQLSEITLSAYKLATLEYINFEEEEDSLLALTPIIRDAMVRRIARAADRAYLRGNVGSETGTPVLGLCGYDTTSVVNPTNTGKVTMANMRALRADMGIWGLDPSGLVYVVSQDVYYDLLEDTTFQSVLQVGINSATLLTGQVGSIGNTPVLVSGEFPTKAGGTTTAATNYAAVAVAPGNFIAGNQRGLRFDVQDMVERQRTALVASLRMGLTTVSNNQGIGLSVMRWS